LNGSIETIFKLFFSLAKSDCF